MAKVSNTVWYRLFGTLAWMREGGCELSTHWDRERQKTLYAALEPIDWPEVHEVQQAILPLIQRLHEDRAWRRRLLGQALGWVTEEAARRGIQIDRKTLFEAEAEIDAGELLNDGLRLAEGVVRYIEALLPGTFRLGGKPAEAERRR